MHEGPVAAAAPRSLLLSWRSYSEAERFQVARGPVLLVKGGSVLQGMSRASLPITTTEGEEPQVGASLQGTLLLWVEQEGEEEQPNTVRRPSVLSFDSSSVGKNSKSVSEQEVCDQLIT